MADGGLPAAGVPTVRSARRRLAFDGIGIMVSGANLATPASGDHGPELLFVTTLAVRQVT